MVWDINGPQGNESGKIKWEIVKWTRGRGLDLGCGIQKTFPHFIGVDNRKDTQLFGHPINPDVTVESAGALPMFASGSMDFVFSSHLLEHFPIQKQNLAAIENPVARQMAARIEKYTALEALKEWMRVLRTDGYLVLYVPDEEQYPKVGEPGANPDHCWNVNYEGVLELMKQTRTAWNLVEFQKRSEGHEYSLFFVFQKRNSGQNVSWRRHKPPKTCAVVRYGAYGDLIQTSSVCAALKAQGYHVTLFTSPPGDDVIRHDPNIDEFYLQDKDQVPNALLGDYWAYHAQKYDKWVNLSESVECTLLSIPGRTVHGWSPAARHRLMNHNYVEMAHLIAGVPFEPRIQFFALESEKKWASQERKKLGGDPLVMWALTGSSVHKTWGGLDPTIASILLEFPEARVLLVGGPDAVILEQGWEQEPRVLCRSGKYTIRETMALLAECDVLIGPETGLMNAASQLELPKVVFLSHSTHENLTRDWKNVTSISSKETHCPGRGANEAPACHQMHYTWQYCKQFRQPGDPRDGTAQCQADIDGAAAWDLIRRAIASVLPESRIQVA